MKVLVISHGPNKTPSKKIGWHLIPFILKKNHGCKICIVSKAEWLRFYQEYLKFRPDIIVSSGIIGIIVTILKKIGLIRCPHAHMWDDHYVECMGKKWGIDRVAWAEYYIIKNADMVSTPSPFLYEQLQLLGIKNRKLVTHGIYKNFNDIKPDFKSFENTQARRKARRKTNCLYVGDLENPQKNLGKMLIELSNCDANVFIAGKITPKITAFISRNNIRNAVLLGEKTNEECIALMKAADVLLLPAKQDSCLKMYEYLASGKPILGLRGRQGYALRHGIDAWLCDNFLSGFNDMMKSGFKPQKAVVCTWEQIAAKHYANLKEILK